MLIVTIFSALTAPITHHILTSMSNTPQLHKQHITVHNALTSTSTSTSTSTLFKFGNITKDTLGLACS